jgi:Zn-dependent M28 family amino/carboxypeptidase
MRIARSACLLVVIATALWLGSSSHASSQVGTRLSARQLIADVQTLSSPEFEGRRTGTQGNAKARAWIVERFRETGLKPLAGNFQVAFRFTRNSADATGVNVVGLCKGRGADDGVMIITAHYDHLGIVNGVFYPGADDNASGVAAILALADWCVARPWTHDAIFVAFDAEEMGLQGARAFVAEPPVAKERLSLNVNLDMVSRSNKGELFVAGTHHRPVLRRILEPIVTRAPVKLIFGHDKPKETGSGLDDWTMQSDHGAFHAAGIPFVYFGVEDHADYHKPGDTADKIEPDFFGRAVGTVLDAVNALDRALPLPRQ